MYKGGGHIVPPISIFLCGQSSYVQLRSIQRGNNITSKYIQLRSIQRGNTYLIVGDLADIQSLDPKV